LVHPPQQGLLEGFSSGLISLANYVADKLPDVKVELLDFGLASDPEIGPQIERVRDASRGTLFVGVTSTTATYQSALQIAQLFKRACRSCVTILGGHHASVQDIVILQHHTDIDFVIRGEGEAALVEFLSRFPAVGDIAGLSFRDGLRVQQNELGPPLEQLALDHIPPTFQGWGLRSAPGKFHHTTYVSARGCPLRCAFCSVSGEPIRAKSVRAVVADLRQLVGSMGCRDIAIEDNFFAQSPARTISLCKMIEELQRELPFRWDCQTRVESCQRDDVLGAMERAGCEAVYLGVESFDPEQLLYLRKTRDPGRYVQNIENRVVPWLLRSRIMCHLNLQLGLPGEGPSHRETVLRHLRGLGKRAKEHGKAITVFPQLHVVYPGTRHFNEALIEGRFGADGETVFERFTAWEARQKPVLQWVGGHFAHGIGGLPEGMMCPDRLRRGEFDINPNAVLEIVEYLDRMEDTCGITVFKYGRYLAGQLAPTETYRPEDQLHDRTTAECR
jgi:radical SAM superfamily enzyme YgiQ (UPF0313 family)